MPEYLAPGVFVEEIRIERKPIEGVSTSVAAFLGPAERGPTRPTLVTSWGAYTNHFGGDFGDQQYLPYAVRGFFENGGRSCYVTRIVDTKKATAASGRIGGVHVKAVGEGSWGRRIAVKVEKGTTHGFKLVAHYWRERPEDLYDPDDMAASDRVPSPALSESFDNLLIDEASPDYCKRRINASTSCLIELENISDGSGEPHPSGLAYLSEGGEEGEQPDVRDYTGETSDTMGQARGLRALEDPICDAVSLLYAPNTYAVKGLAEVLMAHCEDHRYRFLILDAPVGCEDTTLLDPRSQRHCSYAAFYYPWIKVPYNLSVAHILVPPGGHVAGVYARTDRTRGVFKAPAAEALRGAVGVEYEINDRQQNLLNPRGVNVIRRLSGQPAVVWGSRTLSSDPLWHYVNVRRLLIFLERSIQRSTQWAVFEPNDEELWKRMRVDITAFLTQQWRDGALQGSTPDDAFFVKVDRSTMAQADIDNGRVVALVGVAAVKSAEFVMFRIAQKTCENTAL